MIDYLFNGVGRFYVIILSIILIKGMYQNQFKYISKIKNLITKLKL